MVGVFPLIPGLDSLPYLLLEINLLNWHEGHQDMFKFGHQELSIHVKVSLVGPLKEFLHVGVLILAKLPY